jgi:hypothetical protein
MKEPGFHFLIPPFSNVASNPYYVRLRRFAGDIPVVFCNLVKDHLYEIAPEAKLFVIYVGANTRDLLLLRCRQFSGGSKTIICRHLILLLTSRKQTLRLLALREDHQSTADYPLNFRIARGETVARRVCFAIRSVLVFIPASPATKMPSSFCKLVARPDTRVSTDTIVGWIYFLVAGLIVECEFLLWHSCFETEVQTMTHTWQKYQTQLVALSDRQTAVPIGHPGNRVTLAPYRFSFAPSDGPCAAVTQIIWLPGIRRDAIPAI